MPCVGDVCVNIPGPGTILAKAAGDAFDAMAQKWADSANQAVTWLVSGWTKISTPSVGGGPGAWLTTELRPITSFVAILGIIVAAGMVCWKARREGGADALSRMGAGLIRLVVVAGAGTAAVNLLLLAGDEFSNHILASAAPDGDFGKLFNLSAAATMASGMVMILAIVALVGSLIQLFLLLLRNGLLVVLSGAWPTAAAASMTEAGSGMWRKTTGWLLALVCFKPAAAICYAVALRMTLNGTDGLSQASGVLLLLMAVLALPALVRLIVPAVSAIGGASAGAVAAGGVVLATGAISAGRSGGSSGGGAAPAPASPTGSGAMPSGSSGGNGSPSTPWGPRPGGSTAPAGAGAAGSAGGGAAASGAAGGAAAAAGPAAPAVVAVGAVAKGVRAAANGATKATEGGLG